MTGQAELAPRVGVAVAVLGACSRQFLRCGSDLTGLTTRRSPGVPSRANPRVRNLTRCGRPNPPRAAHGWPR
jgi:hypothetical protein